MKKIILSLVLAAAAFNGWLAASGSAGLSTSELKVDDVELVAEGETTSIGPGGTLIRTVIKYGRVVIETLSAGALLYEITEIALEYLPTHYECTSRVVYSNGHGYATFTCEDGLSSDGKDDKCEKGHVITMNF